MNEELIKKLEEIKNLYLENIEDLKKETQKYSNIKVFISNYKNGIFSYELFETFYHLLDLSEDLEFYRKVSITYKKLREKFPERVESYKEILDNLFEIINNKSKELDQTESINRKIEEIQRKISICNSIISMLSSNQELVSVSAIEYMLSDISDKLPTSELVVGLTMSLQSIYERKIKKETIKQERKELSIEKTLDSTDETLYQALSENIPLQSKIDVYETTSTVEESKRLVGHDIKGSKSKEELNTHKEYLEVLTAKEQEEDRINIENATLKNCEEILIEWNSEYLPLYRSVLELLSVLNTKYDELDYKKYNDEGYVLYTKLKEAFDTFVNTVEDYYKALLTNEDVEVYQELLIDDASLLNNIYKEITELLNRENIDISESKKEDNKLVYIMTQNNTPCALTDIKRIPKEYYKTIKELLDSIKDNTFRDSKPCNVTSKLKGVYTVRHTQKKLRVIYKRVKDNYYAILGICIKKDDISKDYHDFALKRYEYYLNSENEIERLLNENMASFMDIQDGITDEIYSTLGFGSLNSGRSMKSGDNNE